jgi:hypothetical protein
VKAHLRADLFEGAQPEVGRATGETGATIVSWQIDPERFGASPLMSNGTVGPMLELRSLFEEYQAQTS